jgi:hypothetical protein
MNYSKLHRFITAEMRMSQIYQPVMLIELLKNNGIASVQQIAQSVLNRDPTQIEYFSEVVKNMVGRVLTKNRGITEKTGDQYHLIGASELTLKRRVTGVTFNSFLTLALSRTLWAAVVAFFNSRSLVLALFHLPSILNLHCQTKLRSRL